MRRNVAWIMVAALLVVAVSVVAVDAAEAQVNRRAKPAQPKLKHRTDNGPVRSMRSPGNTRERTRIGFTRETITPNRPQAHWLGARIGIGFNPEAIAPSTGKQQPRRMGFFSRAELSRPSPILTAPSSILPLFDTRRAIGFAQEIVANDASTSDVPGRFGVRRLIGFAGGFIANRPKLLLPEKPGLMLPLGLETPAPERVIVKGFQANPPQTATPR